MDRIGLTLNEQKTSIRDGRTEEFDFLGYTFGPLYWWKTGKRYMAARPSKKSLQRLRTSVHELLRPHETGPWEQVRTRLNSLLRGWQKYFSYGSVARMYASLNRHVYDRVRHFLRRRHAFSWHSPVFSGFRLRRIGCSRAAPGSVTFCVCT
jgi:RNA-directed DNA polymerase